MLIFGVLPTICLSVVVPGADTPLFYLSSSSSSLDSNLLPLRISGGAGNYATLTGTGPIGKLYFFQGQLTGQDPAGTTSTYRPYISGIPTASGCTDYGPLGFIQGSGTDKCAVFNSFQIQSDTENSQLGAKLVFNFQGGFHACGAGRDIWYKVSPNDGPSDCHEVDLYTIPVA